MPRGARTIALDPENASHSLPPTLTGGDARSRRLRIRPIVALVLLTFLAGLAVGLPGVRHGLPYIDFPDEMTMWTRARALFDTNFNYFQPEYPPGMVAVQYVIQRAQVALGATEYDAGTAVGVGRLTSIGMYALTGCLILLLIWRLLPPVDETAAAFGGLIGAGAWYLLPVVIERGRTTMPDLWMTAGFMGAALCALIAWQERSPRWAWVSAMLAALATLFKWQALAAFILPLLALLAIWPDRRRLALHVLAFAVFTGVFVFWMFAIHGAARGEVYDLTTTPGAPTVDALLRNAGWLLFGAGAPLLIVLPPVALLIAWSQRRLRPVVLVAAPLLLLGLVVINSTVGEQTYVHHYMPGLAVLACLAGLGAGLLLAWKPRRRWLRLSVVIGLIMLIGAGIAAPAGRIAALTAEQILPDRRALLAEWGGLALQDGITVATGRSLADAFDVIYGYRGPRVPSGPGGYWLPDDALSAERLRRDEVRYLIAPSGQDLSGRGLALTPLLTVGEDAAMRGDPWTAYQVGDLPPLEAEPLASFGGEIALQGYTLEPRTVCPGESVRQRMLWSTLQPPDRYYSFYLHLDSLQTGELGAPYNGDPLVAANRPTVTWRFPGEILVGPELVWAIPADLPPGDYDLRLGVYEPATMTALSLADGRPYHILASIHVNPCDTNAPEDRGDTGSESGGG